MKVRTLSTRRSWLLLLLSVWFCAPAALWAQVGGLDPAFAPGVILNGAAPGVVRAQVVQSDGKVIIAGDFTSVGGVARGRIARLNVDGSLDASYAAGAGADGPIHALVFETSGRVLIGGTFLAFDGTARGRLARLTSAGALDTTFGAGAGANDTVQAILYSPPNAYVGGDFTQVHGATRGRLARLTSTGTVDSSWNPGTGANGTVHALALESFSGRLFAGGAFTTFNGQQRLRLAAFSTFSGSLDFSFNATGGPDGTVRAMLMPPASFSLTNSLFIGGDFQNVGSSPRGRLAALSVSSSANYGVDPSLTVWLDAPVHRLALGSAPSTQSALLVGGEFAMVDGRPRARLARMLGKTSGSGSSQATYWDFDPGFNMPAGANGTVRAISALSDGKTLVGGEFSAIADIPTQSVARLYSDAGSQPPATPGGVTATTASASQIVLTFNVVTNATSYKLERSANGVDGWTQIAAVTASPFIDSDLTPGATWFYRCKSANTNGDSAPGTVVNATTDASVWTGAGVLDPASNVAGTDGTVNAVAVQSDGSTLLAGSFTTVQGVPRKNIARLLPNWTVDPSFDPGTGPDGTVYDLAVQPDGRIVIGGSFTNVAGTARSYVARLEPNGALDATFFNPGSGPSSIVRLVGLQPNGRVVIGGSFSSVNGVSRNYIARLYTDGTFDPSLNAEVSSSPDSLSIQRDGRIVIGGSFSTVSGVDRRRVARLLPDGSLDTSFNAGSITSIVESVAALNDGKILVGGSFTTINSIARTRVARLNADGSVDPTFDPGTGPDLTVTRVVPQPDGKVLIAGSFTKVAGALRPRLARLNADGTLDTTFQPGAGTFETVNAVVVAPDTRVVVGGNFTSFGIGTPARVARLAGDGWSAAPPAPTGLAVAPVSAASLLVTWSDVDGEQAWKLERSPNGATNWVPVATLPWDVTSFTDTGLTAATTFHYRLAAANGAGDSSFSPSASASTLTLFQQWVLDSGFPLTATDTSDDDGDGIGLFAEYGLGLDPTVASFDGAPVGQVVGDVMALSYRRYRSDVNYLVEASTDLETWSSLGVNQGSGPFPIAWKFAAGLPQLYLRLRMTRP